MNAAALDQIFKAYDIRGVYPDPLNEAIARRIGRATADFLRQQNADADPAVRRNNMLVVGRDMRPSSEALALAVTEGIRSAGMDCLDVGLIDTPLIYFAINYGGFSGGIQTTASHNPVNYNGFKISGPAARPIGETTGLREIKRLCGEPSPSPAAAPGALERQDFTAAYRQHVLRFLKPVRPLTVAVDASNGMAGQFLPDIFLPEPKLNLVPLNLEITGAFNHPPNPLVDANLRQLQEAVLSSGAAFGVCFDGDADRCVFVDEQARVIRCDIITALLARHFLKDHPHATVVYDLRSSRVVKEEIENAGGIARRERVGHAFMKKALADSHGVLGGELSGHFYFRDNFNCDSGAIAFACVASVFSQYDVPVSQVLKPLLRWHGSGEVNFQVADKDGAMARLAERYQDAAIDYLDGVTVEYDTWWFNVRKSNTEPLLRLNLEANTAEAMKKKLEEVSRQLGAAAQ